MKKLLSPLLRATRLSTCFLAIASLLLLVSTANAQESNEKKVGIAVSAVINTTLESGVMVSKALGEALEKKLNVQVVAGAQAQGLLPAKARDESCLGKSSCLVEAGKALGVDELLMLIIVDIGDNFKIEATWIDIRLGTTALRPAIDSPKAIELLATSFENQVQVLLPDTELRTVKNSSTELDTSTDVVEHKSTTQPNITKTLPEAERKWTGTSKALFWGGSAVVVGWLGYGGVRVLGCGGIDCNETTTDGIVDVIGGVGVAAASIGLILYLTNKSDKEVPVAVNVAGDSLAFTYQGIF